MWNIIQEFDFLIKKGRISLLRDNTFKETVSLLFDYLNGTFRALCFTCSANQTFTYFGWYRFAVFDLVYADRASVDTSFASSAFRIDNNFYHFVLPLCNIFIAKGLPKIKGFRYFSVFFHVNGA